MSGETIAPSSPELRANLHHLYWDVLWIGIFGGSLITFISVYLTRIGATSLQIGLITAGPALINLIFSIPIGHWLEGRDLFRMVSTTSFLAREGYLLIAFLPLFLTDSLRIWVTILVILLMALPSTIFIISFNAIFAEVVPPAWRAHVVGRRGAVMALSLSATLFTCGQLLDWLPHPYNYILVFGAGAVSAMLSCYHLSKIRPEGKSESQNKKFLGEFLRPQPSEIRSSPDQSQRSPKALLRKDLILSSFGLFIFSYLAFYAFQYLPIPIFPIYFVRELGLSDGQIGLANALFNLTMMLGSLRLSLASSRWGHRKLMVGGALIFGQYPLLVGLARGPGLVYLTSLVAGFNYSFLSGGQTNRLMERVPMDDRPARMALHNLALNFGILVGSLGGPFLGDSLGLRGALFLAAGLRLLSGILLGWWG